jgi:cell division topological specificity factor
MGGGWKMLDLSKFFGWTQKNSKDLAKERLKLVLVHDRANVSPQFLEMVKGEIIKVINNYMDIDEGALEIQMTRTKSEDGNRMVPALVANIPIRNVKNSGR